MRAFAWFFGLIVFAFVMLALLAYPAWLLLYPTFDFPFHRIGSRIAMLAAAVGFFVIARHIGVANRASLGYGAPRPVFIRELFIGLALGIAMMLPVVGAMVGLDLRELKEGVTLDAATLAELAVEGVMRGLAVSLIEETFVRGAMYTAIDRESGARTAIILTSLVYASLHFVGRFRIPHEEVGPGSGVDLLLGTLRLFGDPLAIADAFICFFVVGVILGIVRMLTGNIAACIGLHAGWVFIITFVRETSGPDQSNSLSFLLSRFDGFVGWLVTAWAVVMGAVLWRLYTRRLAKKE